MRQVKNRKLKDLKDYEFNNRNHPEDQVKQIAKSIEQFGWTVPILIDEQDVIIAGHGRVLAARTLGQTEVPCITLEGLTEQQIRAYRILDNKLTTDSTWAMDNLSLEVSWLEDAGFEVAEWGLDELVEDWREDQKEVTDDEFTEEDPENIFIKKGDLLELGGHRVLCGDSTSAEDVAELMQGKKAELIHADPPYGMGKENEGVENDNLYRDKLDAFQMEWWKAFRGHVNDNASAYIWGNPEGLWRLWFIGGLKDSERLTFRNQIIWDKKSGQGMSSNDHRMYPTVTEHCLFFMLGEQGFNNNADNYWEGFEPIRNYLDTERIKLGWNNKTVASFFGFHPRMADHWFSKSQWSFLKKEQYERLQQEAAKGDGFKKEYDELKKEYDELKKEYDELKKEFYSTRAYFDNAHENMTDVWDYSRVVGEDRHGHATPKPVAMIARAIKSSSPEGGIVAEPFLGSGTTLIAADQLDRICYGMEISPKYCQVILDRWCKYREKEGKPIEAKINGEVYKL